MIYGVIYSRFRKLRKKLEKLKKSTDECNTTSKLSFHQKVGIFTKVLRPDIPGIQNEQIQTIEIKGLACGQEGISEEKIVRQRKRHPSAVLKNLTILASHTRAAKYFLVIVSTLVFTWTPFMSFSLYDSLEYKSLVESNTDFDIAKILFCVETALQKKDCNVSMVIGNGQEIKETIRNLFHFEE